MTGKAIVIRADARALPLPDESVDLIVTSPPYFALRSYTDAGEHYAGQIGSEPSPAEYIAALVDCTREWVRVLKPCGSIFVNLGDKYSQYEGVRKGHGRDLGRAERVTRGEPLELPTRAPQVWGIAAKSLMLLPERYRIACVDQLGLIARAVIVWHKPNGLPESVTDRVRRSHEDWVHLTKQPRYYSAVDEIREPHTGNSHPRGGNASVQEWTSGKAARHRTAHSNPADFHTLGKLPGSVWEINSEPLRVPAELGVNHHAAFPTEWPHRLILGWSPPGICTACGEGRRPVVTQPDLSASSPGNTPTRRIPGQGRNPLSMHGQPGSTLRLNRNRRLIGYVCTCTPYTDHPERRQPTVTPSRNLGRGHQANDAHAGSRHHGNDWPTRQPVRDYHLDGWTPPATHPAVVLDPFGGSGTTALVAAAFGRIGITVDRSADYCRLATWRVNDPAERARALRVAKPPAQVDGQESLFDLDVASAEVERAASPDDQPTVDQALADRGLR